MRTLAKLNDRLVEILAVRDRVEFSDQLGWILITTDAGQDTCRQIDFRWTPATTRFEWRRLSAFWA
jgi:hypothetical protein